MPTVTHLCLDNFLDPTFTPKQWKESKQLVFERACALIKEGKSVLVEDNFEL